jgi:hypothetical protein
MGRGGTDALWSSGLTCRIHCDGRYSGRLRRRNSEEVKRYNTHLEIIFSMLLAGVMHKHSHTPYSSSLTHQGYRDKPYGQLVLVSLMHYCTSTPSLSTSWSRTTLQRNQVPGKSHLKASFPLRCFQRLSLPNLATRQCHWRDNRYTRGSSTPVLSY